MYAKILYNMDGDEREKNLHELMYVQIKKLAETEGFEPSRTIHP